MRWFFCALFSFVLLGLGILFAPVEMFRATPSDDLDSVTTAIVFGFGFEEDAEGAMLPGAANSFLLDHVLTEHPQVDTIFVQEGVWVDRCEREALTCEVDGVRLLRIDWHDERFDLNTLEISACVLERMELFELDAPALPFRGEPFFLQPHFAARRHHPGGPVFRGLVFAPRGGLDRLLQRIEFAQHRSGIQRVIRSRHESSR